MSTASLKQSKGVLRVELTFGQHERLQAWMQKTAHTPTSAIKAFVSSLLAGHVDADFYERAQKARSKRHRVASYLGELREPFARLCQERGLSARALVECFIDSLDAPAAGGRVAAAGVVGNEPKFHEVGGTGDAARKYPRISLTHSEWRAWELLATQRDEAPNQLMRRILRAYLTKKPGFTNEEVALLGTNNLLLLRSSNNLNQIAKKLNSGALFSDSDLESLQLEVKAIKQHVEKVSALLSSNRERWLIEADQSEESVIEHG